MVWHSVVSFYTLTPKDDSKHVLNVQVSIRAPCCKQWFDCAECHAETQSHRLAKATEMAFICKKCKKAFRKDIVEFEESDEYCPHCDNHFVSADFMSFFIPLRRSFQVLDAVTPKSALRVEGEDPRVDARCELLHFAVARLFTLPPG